MAADDRAGPSGPDRHTPPGSDGVPDGTPDRTPAGTPAGGSDGPDAGPSASPGVTADAPDRDVAPVGGAAPSLGAVALAHRPGAIATMDLADRPAAFEDLDAAIVAELRAIEDL